METNESLPLPLPDPDNRDDSDHLLAYREYWDGHRWLVGVYVDLTGGAEVDNFSEGGESGESQVDRP